MTRSLSVLSLRISDSRKRVKSDAFYEHVQERLRNADLLHKREKAGPGQARQTLHFCFDEAPRRNRNAKSDVLDLVLLSPVCEVGLRCAVALGHVHRMHRT